MFYKTFYILHFSFTKNVCTEIVLVELFLPGISQNGVPTDDIAEDEDLLNVALWYRSRKGF